jgi:hypothetical protein
VPCNAKHRRAELRPRPRHGHQEPATSAPSPPRHGSHAELHAASTVPSSPSKPLTANYDVASCSATTLRPVERAHGLHHPAVLSPLL